MNDREEIEAEASKAADRIVKSHNLKLLFGKKQSEMIIGFVRDAYVIGKCQAKIEEIVGITEEIKKAKGGKS